MTKIEPVVLCLDSKIYSLQAIKRASYDFTDRCYITISQVENGKFALSVIIKENVPNCIIQELMSSLLDHQIRVDLEQEFGVLRTIIAAQAFAPSEDIEEIIRISNHD